MKKLFLVFVIGVVSIGLYGQTQLELNTKSKVEFEKTDKELNKIYLKILFEYKSDAIFINNMKEAQRQWIKFRDAQIKMKYPSYKDVNLSVKQMCINYYLKELTTNRIKELKKWLDGVEEGDICCGSIRINQ